MDHCIALYAAEFKVGPNVFILKKYAYPFRELEPKPSDPDKPKLVAEPEVRIGVPPDLTSSAAQDTR